jgi:hypothetical protein
MSGERFFVAAACAVVLAGVAAAFFAIGPPSYARSIALDEHRVADLRAIAHELNERYAKAGAKLPQRLPNDLPATYFADADRGDVRNFTEDPVMDRPYGYRRLSAKHYALCADFALANEPEDGTDATAYLRYWSHGAGRTCYSFDVSQQPPEPHVITARQELGRGARP